MMHHWRRYKSFYPRVVKLGRRDVVDIEVHDPLHHDVEMEVIIAESYEVRQV